MANEKTRRLYVAKQSFATEFEGTPVVIQKGNTVEEGHPLLKGREDLFKLIEADFKCEDETERRVEDASAEPGRKRGER